MAKVQFGIIVTDVTGSIGGVTFQKNASGSIIRRRSFPASGIPDGKTGIQVALFSLLQTWQGLTLTQKNTWNIFAGANPKTNKFGQLKKLTGLNWYTSVNFQRRELGLADFTVPPVNSIPEVVSSLEVTIKLTKLEITLGGPFDFGDNSILVWGTQPTTRSTSTVNQLLKKLTTLTTGPIGTFDITAAWTAATGFPWEPLNLFPTGTIIIKVQSVRRSTGITSPFITDKANVFSDGTGIGIMRVGSTNIVG